jgi:hypothetical protein
MVNFYEADEDDLKRKLAEIREARERDESNSRSRFSLDDASEDQIQERLREKEREREQEEERAARAERDWESEHRCGVCDGSGSICTNEPTYTESMNYQVDMEGREQSGSYERCSACRGRGYTGSKPWRF